MKHVRDVGDGVEDICDEGLAGVGAVSLGLLVGARISVAHGGGAGVAHLSG
jgi:hypothetical protein